MMTYMTLNLLECFGLPLHTCFNDHKYSALLLLVPSPSPSPSLHLLRGTRSVNTRSADSFASLKRRLEPELFASIYATWGRFSAITPPI